MLVKIRFMADVLGDPSDVLDGSIQAMDDLQGHLNAAGVTIVSMEEEDVSVEEVE